MKPHIWFRANNWHCGVPSIDAGVTVVWWPRGVGDTPAEAYRDFEKRSEHWRMS